MLEQCIFIDGKPPRAVKTSPSEIVSASSKLLPFAKTEVILADAIAAQQPKTKYLISFIVLLSL